MNSSVNSPVAIRVSDLHYSYKKSVSAEALQGISFEVSFGKITGLLGPNGSGKSTSFKIISTQLFAVRGDVEVCGFSVSTQSEKVRSCMGVTFQSPSLDPILTIQENLEIHAALMGVSSREARERISLRLSQMKLTDRAHDRVKELSGGLARRAELAKTLLSDPKILLLDEPTSGLDPSSRRDFWAVLREFVSPERAIFVTTHLMEEAELCDSLVFISEGRIAASGTPQELRNDFEKDIVFLEAADLDGLRANVIKHLSDDEVCVLLHSGLRIETPRAVELTKLLQEKYGGFLRGLSWSRGTLSDVYFKKTGKALES